MKPRLDCPLEMQLEYARSLSPSLAAMLAMLFALFVAALFAPDILDLPEALYVPVHSIMEVFAVVVAALVFALGWHAEPGSKPGRTQMIACAFLAVALLDLGHMLSIKGMPDFVTPASPEKGIAFWLPGRLADAIALLLAATAAWRAPMQRGRWVLLAASLGFTTLVYVVVLAWPELLPRTFVPGEGLTPFKIGAEYAIVAVHLLTLALLWRQLGGNREYDVAGLFCATAVMAMSELLFTLYGTPHDVYLLLGHIYKVIAYAFVYRAVFVDAVRRPYARMRSAEERERHAIQAALDASEARFQAMADTAPCILYTRGADGVIDFVNRRGCEYTGLAPGKHVLDTLVHPDDAQRLQHAVAQAQRAGSAYEVELRLRAADGSYRWFAGAARPFQGESGLRWFGTFADIDALKRHEAALRSSEHALREADRRKDEFLATLGHELRNPLAPLRNGLEVLRLAPDDAPRRQLVQEMMERQLAHMVRLIDDLLDLSRITTGKLTLRREKLDLRDVLRGAVEASETVLRSHGHQLEFAPPAPGELLVNGDAARLNQIVVNLLTNAAKFTERGGQIALCAKRDGKEAIISVRDSGIGIAKQNLEAIFELFAQPHDQRLAADAGLGIGLTLARRLAGLHGGSIAAFSAGMKTGSEFVVRLRLMEPRADTATAPQCSRPAPGPSRILVVDDNVDAAASLGVLLEMHQHEVQLRHEGGAALEAAEAMRPDLILLDLGMPGMDGYEIARRIRAEPWGTGLRIVALSGWGQDDHKQKSLEAGFDAHITKPVEPKRLQCLLSGCASFSDSGCALADLR